MKTRFLPTCATTLALLTLIAAPASALAQGRGHGNHGDNGKHLGWTRGRHLGWYKQENRGGDDDEDYRRSGGYSNGSRWPVTTAPRGYSGAYPGGYYGGNYNDYQSSRRQQTKNEWRNLAIASGIVGALGYLNHDKTLTFAGAAGALYSLYRYEQDRKSQSQYNRARAYYFSQPYFYRDGVRYDRRQVTVDGQRYYQFRRR